METPEHWMQPPFPYHKMKPSVRPGRNLSVFDSVIRALLSQIVCLNSIKVFVIEFQDRPSGILASKEYWY